MTTFARRSVKLIVHESIPEVTRNRELAGWVRGTDVIDPKPMLEEMSQLRADNARLLKRAADAEKRLSSEAYQGYSFDELLKLLAKEVIDLSNLPGKHGAKEAPILNVFMACADELGVGVENWVGMNDTKKFIFFELAPKLAVYGLTEKKSVNSKGIQRFQTSELGNRFLAKAKPLFNQLVRVQEAKSQEEMTTSTGAAPATVATEKSPKKQGHKATRQAKPKPSD